MTTKNNIEKLFRSNYTAMLTLAERLTHNRETARDIVHDVFASLIHHAPTEVTTSYLLNGVRFACIKHIRALGVGNRLAEMLALNPEGIEDDWPDEEEVAYLQGIINNMLSEQCQRVIRFRFTSGLTYGEIAEEMHISEAAVYKHLCNAMNILRQNFRRDER